MKAWALKLPNRQVLLLNGAVIFLMVGAGSYGIRSALFREDLPRCTERASHAVRMTLERDGNGMQPSELQAAMGGSDWNVLENARVVSLKSGPAPRALEVRTGPLKTAGSVDNEQRPGVGFVWTPQTVNTSRGNCLSYSFYVPEGFAFGGGGRLPGFVGGGQAGSKDPAGSLATRLAWDEQGKFDVLLKAPGVQNFRGLGGNRDEVVLPRGTWVNIEKELVLNSAGAADGELRLWVDGKLVMEHKKLTVRTSDATFVSGVVSEVLVQAKQNQAAKPANVWLSPFEIRW
jgi:hypothetical protein